MSPEERGVPVSRPGIGDTGVGTVGVSRASRAAVPGRSQGGFRPVLRLALPFLVSLAIFCVFWPGTGAADICDLDTEERAMASAWEALFEEGELLGVREVAEQAGGDWELGPQLLNLKVQRTRDQIARLIQEKAEALDEVSRRIARMQLGPGACKSSSAQERVVSPFFSRYAVDLASCLEVLFDQAEGQEGVLSDREIPALSASSGSDGWQADSVSTAGESHILWFFRRMPQFPWRFSARGGKTHISSGGDEPRLQDSESHRSISARDRPSLRAEGSPDAEDETLAAVLASLLFTKSFPRDVVTQELPPDTMVENGDSFPEFNLTRLGNRYGRVSYVDFRRNASFTYPRTLGGSHSMELTSPISTQQMRSHANVWDYPNLQPDQASIYDQADVAIIAGYQTCNRNPGASHDTAADLFSYSYGEYELLYDDPASYEFGSWGQQGLSGPQEEKKRVQDGPRVSAPLPVFDYPELGYLAIAVDIARAIMYGVSRRSSVSVSFASSSDVISLDGVDTQALNRLDRLDVFLDDVLEDARENAKAGICILPEGGQFLQALHRVIVARRNEVLRTRTQASGKVYIRPSILQEDKTSAERSGSSGEGRRGEGGPYDRELHSKPHSRDGEEAKRAQRLPVLQRESQNYTSVKPLVIYVIGSQMNLASSALSEHLEDSKSSMWSLMRELSIRIVFVPIDLDSRLSRRQPLLLATEEETVRLNSGQKRPLSGSARSVAGRDVMYRKAFSNLYRSFNNAVYYPFCTADYLDSPFIQVSLFSASEKYSRASFARFQIEPLLKPLMRSLDVLIGRKALSSGEGTSSGVLTAESSANGPDDYWLATPFVNPHGLLVTSMCKRVIDLKPDSILGDAPPVDLSNHYGNLCVEIALAALLSLPGIQASRTFMYLVDTASLNVLASNIFLGSLDNTCAWNPHLCRYLTQPHVNSNYLQLGWNIMPEVQPRALLTSETEDWQPVQGSEGTYARFFGVTPATGLIVVIKNPALRVPALPPGFSLETGEKACWYGVISRLNYYLVNEDVAALIGNPADEDCCSTLYVPPDHFLAHRPGDKERFAGLGTTVLTDPGLGYRFYLLQQGELGPFSSEEENPLRVDGLPYPLASEARYLTFFQHWLMEAYAKLDVLRPGSVYVVGLMFVDGVAVTYPPNPCTEYIEDLRRKLTSAAYAEYVVDCACMCRIGSALCTTCRAQVFSISTAKHGLVGAGFVLLNPGLDSSFFDALLRSKARKTDQYCFLASEGGSLFPYSPIESVPVFFLPQDALAGGGMIGSRRARRAKSSAGPAGVIGAADTAETAGVGEEPRTPQKEFGRSSLEENLEYHRALTRHEAVMLRRSFGAEWEEERDESGRGLCDWDDWGEWEAWGETPMDSGGSARLTGFPSNRNAAPSDSEGVVPGRDSQHSYLSRTLYYLWLNRYLRCHFSHDGLLAARALTFSPELRAAMESVRTNITPPDVDTSNITSSWARFSRLSKYKYEYLNLLSGGGEEGAQDGGGIPGETYAELGIEYVHVGLISGLQGLLVIDPRIGEQFDLEPGCKSYSGLSTKLGEIHPYLYVANRLYPPLDFLRMEYPHKRHIATSRAEAAFSWVLLAAFLFWAVFLLTARGWRRGIMWL